MFSRSDAKREGAMRRGSMGENYGNYGNDNNYRELQELQELQ
jgi:hypothetical protein